VPEHADNVIDLIRNADAAMYHAKRQGRNCHVFYVPEMNAAAVERLLLKSKLRRALERNEFVLHYQPKVDLASGAVVGSEALLRWRHPEYGFYDRTASGEAICLASPEVVWQVLQQFRSEVLGWPVSLYRFETATVPVGTSSRSLVLPAAMVGCYGLVSVLRAPNSYEAMGGWVHIDGQIIRNPDPSISPSGYPVLNLMTDLLPGHQVRMTAAMPFTLASTWDWTTQLDGVMSEELQRLAVYGVQNELHAWDEVGRTDRRSQDEARGREETPVGAALSAAINMRRTIYAERKANAAYRLLSEHPIRMT
jgi:hypothetical protein